MPLWYNLPAKDSKFANLACSEWSLINSKIEFKELGIKEDESFYHLFAQATEVTDIKFAKGDKSWKFEPQPIQFRVAKKDYEKYSFDEKKQVPVKQTVVEKFYCKCFENLDLEKVYIGRIYFQNIPQIEMVMNGEGGEKMMEMTVTSMCSLTPVDSPEFIKLDELQIPTTGSKNYTKPQSEKDRLYDRISIFLEQLKIVFPELELNSVADLVKHYSDEQNTIRVQEAMMVIGRMLGDGI